MFMVMDMKIDELVAVLKKLGETATIDELKEILCKTAEDIGMVCKIIEDREFPVYLFNPRIAEVKLNYSDLIRIPINPDMDINELYKAIRKFTADNIGKIVGDILGMLRIKLETIAYKLTDEEDENAEGEQI